MSDGVITDSNCTSGTAGEDGDTLTSGVEVEVYASDGILDDSGDIVGVEGMECVSCESTVVDVFEIEYDSTRTA